MIVESFHLEPGPIIPNNPRLPVILYREALEPQPVLAAEFERAFSNHGWHGIWHNGIFDYHHYHSRAHEVLGIARGHAHVILGGPTGREFTLAAGDCVLLPAGTGHCRLSASPDYLVIGAYPPGQSADMQTGAADEAILAAIRNCPRPSHDPVDGGDGAIANLWQAANP